MIPCKLQSPSGQNKNILLQRNGGHIVKILKSVYEAIIRKLQE